MYQLTPNGSKHLWQRQRLKDEIQLFYKHIYSVAVTTDKISDLTRQNQQSRLTLHCHHSLAVSSNVNLTGTMKHNSSRTSIVFLHSNDENTTWQKMLSNNICEIILHQWFFSFWFKTKIHVFILYFKSSKLHETAVFCARRQNYTCWIGPFLEYTRTIIYWLTRVPLKSPIS